jgi:hypothetical protein
MMKIKIIQPKYLNFILMMVIMKKKDDMSKMKRRGKLPLLLPKNALSDVDPEIYVFC